jgi:hypothetical protein
LLPSCISAGGNKPVCPEISDGYSVIFRTVADDEAWSLSIHMPKGDVVKMADLCRQIITNAKAKKPDEKKYFSNVFKIKWMYR